MASPWLSGGLNLGNGIRQLFSDTRFAISVWTWFSRTWQSVRHWQIDARVVFWVYCEIISYPNTQQYFRFSSSQHVVGLHRASEVWADVTHVTSGAEHVTAGVNALVCPSPAITTGDVQMVEPPSARISEEDNMEQNPLKTYKGHVAGERSKPLSW